MVMYKIYTQNVDIKYRAHFCSFASLYLLCAIAISFISPLFIAYHSQGLWLKESSYREQGDVHFKHEFIMLLYGTSDDLLLGYSTFTNLNIFLDDRLRIPVIKSREYDINHDGRKDYLTFQLEVPLQQNEVVHRIDLLLLFDYQLHFFPSLQMESMAYITYTSALSGSNFNTDGELKLVQKVPLPHRGSHTTYNVSIIDDTGLIVENFDWSRILGSYKSRNISTHFMDPYPVWKIGASSNNKFTINAKVTYPEELITYRPGIWQILKTAWIQYLSILVIFLFVFYHLNDFIFKNQLVTTVVSKKVHED